MRTRCNMQAVILSGGKGKRLQPITSYIPKSLVPVDNVPIIEWQIRYFKRFGIRDIVICAGHLSNQLINHLESKKLDVQIRFSIENTPLGTGGAIKKARKYIKSDTFFVINGDVITNIDLKKLQTANSIAVIPLITVDGVIHTLGNKITKVEEKPEIANNWMNSGIYYLDKTIFYHLPQKGNIETIAFPSLAKKRQLNVVKFTNVFWNSIDSHKDIETCSSDMKKNQYEKFLQVK